LSASPTISGRPSIAITVCDAAIRSSRKPRSTGQSASSGGLVLLDQGTTGQTVTVCQDTAGTEESSRRAAEWVKENIGVTVDAPTVTEGSAVLHF
jgi:orotate phosphoribosyltransferase